MRKYILPIAIIIVILVFSISTWMGPNFSKNIQENAAEETNNEIVWERQETFPKMNEAFKPTPHTARPKPSTRARPKPFTRVRTKPSTTARPKLSTTSKPKAISKPKLELQEPREAYTIRPLPESAAICEDVFPPKAVTSPIGCRRSQKAPPGLTFKCYEPIILSCDDSLEVTREKYYRYITRNNIECDKTWWVGIRGRGGWKACMAGPFKPKVNNCITYGFGVQRQWSFDEAISSVYGCNSMAFDPSIGKQDHQHSERVWFYNLGLSGKDEEKNSKGWKMRTLYSVMKELNHVNKTIDILKFDVEFSEWEAIAAMLKDKALVNVKQIAFEIHTWRDTVKDYIYFWQILQGLEDIGFEKWYHYSLRWRSFYPDGIQRFSPQANLYYINTNFIKAKG